MKITALALPLLAGFCFADYTTVSADLNALSAGLTQLDNDVNAYIGGILGFPDALQVQVDAVNLDKIILQATSDANNSPAFGPIGSLNISATLLALEPKISSTLSDTSNKNALFADFKPVVLATLYQLKLDTDVLSAAIVKKLDALEAALAPVIVGQIDSAFNSAIVAYGGTAQK